MKPEIIVFGLIAVLVLGLTFGYNIPQNYSDLSELPVISKAPEFTGIVNWINSEPLTLEELRGKVVLIDFWTYTCINCIRTLPFLKEWHDKYTDDGLVIVGVHTPEFEFEKDTANVLAAVEKYELKYAIAQDNDYKTWIAYQNRYWPRKYLIDSEGNIRYDHIGEGAYEETETAIQKLLAEINPEFSEGTLSSQISDTDFSKIGTPELFLGYEFAQFRTPLGNPEGFQPGQTINYAKQSVTIANRIYLEGLWENQVDRSITRGNSNLVLTYTAKNVNIVAGGDSKIIILLNDEPIPIDSYGSDVIDGEVLINEQRLFNIVSTPGYATNKLEIKAEPGFELYSFTFG